MVGYHRETHHFSEEKSTKEFTAPQHTRFILPPFHPTKSSLRCVGVIFLLWETHIENFMIRPDVIPTFLQRRCKTGVGTSFGANGDQHTRTVELSTYFCVLTIRKQLPRNGFERSGRGPETVLSAAVEGKNRPVATNFQFLKISCPSGTSLLQCVCISEVILLG